MDSDTIGIKVAKMPRSPKRPRLSANIPTVSMSEIKRMKIEAAKRDTTLFEVYKEECSPAKMQTVTIAELKQAKADADSDDVAVGVKVKEMIDQKQEDRDIEVAKEEAKIEAAAEEAAKAEETVEEVKAEIPETEQETVEEEEPAETEEVEETPPPRMPAGVVVMNSDGVFLKAVGQKTKSELRAFAKAQGIKFLAKDRNDQLAQKIVDGLEDRSTFTAFFAE